MKMLEREFDFEVHLDEEMHENQYKHHSEPEYHHKEHNIEPEHDYHRHHHHDHAHDDHQIGHDDHFDSISDHELHHDYDGDNHFEHDVPLQFYFIISAILFCGCFVTLYMFPILSNKFFKKKTINSSKHQMVTQVLNCLGAGVLLGLALLDILPELRESISSITNEKDIHYPLAELGMLLSTFLIAMLDNWIHQFCEFIFKRTESQMTTDSEQHLVNPSLSSSLESQGQAAPRKNKPIIGKITKIIIGLLLHSILTGMSIGMRGTQDEILAGLLAIIPHKLTVLIVLSTLTLEISRISRFIHILLFSIAMPIGFLLSIVISKLPEGFLVCNLEALGCGAVFYVAVIEILPDALKGDWKNRKYFTVLVGIAIVASIQISHSHSHDDHDHHSHDE